MDDNEPNYPMTKKEHARAIWDGFLGVAIFVIFYGACVWGLHLIDFHLFHNKFQINGSSFVTFNSWLHGWISFLPIPDLKGSHFDHFLYTLVVVPSLLLPLTYGYNYITIYILRRCPICHTSWTRYDTNQTTNYNSYQTTEQVKETQRKDVNDRPRYRDVYKDITYQTEEWDVVMECAKCQQQSLIHKEAIDVVNERVTLITDWYVK